MAVSMEVSSRELSGVHICAAPGCHRQLHGRQGMDTRIGERTVRTCFGLSCVQWAEQRARIESMS